ncbi:MAG: hypothetical protein Q9162_007110 [Coniocarpon cinnabarinum]
MNQDGGAKPESQFDVGLGHTTPAIEEDHDSSSSVSSVSSTGTIVPSGSLQPSSRPQVAWHDYFDQELHLSGHDIRYHVYLTSPKDPSKDPLFVCHHGAGSCGLSFALFAKEVRKRLPAAGILSVDARGHGYTTSSKLENDFSLPTLSEDLAQVIRLTHEQRNWKDAPSLCVVGHSLGGAVVTRLAKNATFGARLVGFAIIDVVEGSAMEALKSMQAYLANRPASFNSVDAAVEWHTRSRTVRNPASAAISTPPLLVETSEGRWTWRTDLTATKLYWEQWFGGMSKNFLAGKAAKLLMLAGTDRLDKELMIGQMQGKFQLQVFPEAGHFVQEDLPEQTAETVVEFFKRNDRSTLVLPPKVSDLIAQGKKV